MNSAYITPVAVDIHSRYLPLYIPQNLLDDLVKKVTNKSNLTILEIGAGNGMFIEKFLDNLSSMNRVHIDVHLVEPNEYFFSIINSIKERYSGGNISFYLYNIYAESFVFEDDTSFDIIIANRVFNQIEDWKHIATWIKQQINESNAIFVFTESKGEIYEILNFNHSLLHNPISIIFDRLYQDYFGNRLYQDRRKGINVCDMGQLVDFFRDSCRISSYLIEWRDPFSWSDYCKIIENYAIYPIYSKYLYNNCFDEHRAKKDVGNFIEELKQSLKRKNLNFYTNTNQLLSIKYYLIEK